MKQITYWLLLLMALLTACENKTNGPKPGISDPRVVGTWQLYEQRYLRDSTYRKDSTYTVDTTYTKLNRYVPNPAQVLTFGTDGTVRASGSAMQYYFPIHYYSVDSTFLCNGYYLNVHFFISTNRDNVGPQQRLAFNRDTLLLMPSCDSIAYLKLLKLR